MSAVVEAGGIPNILDLRSLGEWQNTQHSRVIGVSAFGPVIFGHVCVCVCDVTHCTMQPGRAGLLLLLLLQEGCQKYKFNYVRKDNLRH